MQNYLTNPSISTTESKGSLNNTAKDKLLQHDASVQGSSDLLRVQKGESISLNCSMRNRYEINWYLLRYEKLDLLISAEKDKTGRRLLINYNPYVTRVKMTADTWVTRATVDISGVTESDSGLYFCGTKSDAPEMFFDKPIRLEIKGLTVVQETKEEADNTDGVKLTERVFMYGGVGLAVLVFFVATFIAGAIIHYCETQNRRDAFQLKWKDEMTRFHSSHVTRSALTADLRMNCLYLLLFLCLLNYRVTSTELVIEQRGGYVILPCDYEESEIAEIGFSRSENSTVCWNKECESDRIFKKENHDIVIKNLSFSDAGKYILRCSYINNQSELEQQNRTYQLHIHDEVSVKIGEELKLDVLLPNTDKVQHQGRRSTGWKEDWSRTDGVQSERLTIRDGNLIISNFTARDAGTYIVLDSKGNIMIMVTVRVSSTVSSTELELKGKLNYTGYDKPNYITKQQRMPTTSVIGQKGGYVTLPCEHEDSEITEIGFSRSENSTVCQNKECESDRIFNKENCGIIIKNLSFSDAGKYIFRYSYITNQTMLEQIRTYQLCVDDEISVKIGEELKLDVLLPNTDKVQHQGRRSTGWKEDWSRTDGVQSERLTIRDGNLIISNFTARDAGTYEVLDPEGNILIMVKVSVSSTVSSTELESKGKLNYTGYDKPNDTKQQRTTAVPVKGEKGGKVTLPCEYETNTIFHTDLINSISVKTGEELKMDVLLPNADKVEANSGGEWRKVWKRGHRVWREQMIGSDGNQIIKVFKANDAGTYRVLDSEGNILITVTVTETTPTLMEVKKGDNIPLQYEISVKIGEELKLDVLLPNADKVQHQSRRSTGWKEDWSRTDGVQSERRTIRDGKLIISHFTARDAGTYEVLDPEGNILIMVTGLKDHGDLKQQCIRSQYLTSSFSTAKFEELSDELQQSIEKLNSEYNRNHKTLADQIKKLNNITEELESMHKNTTRGSLVGASMGAAGGIALLGIVLAPFTFGASIAVTGAAGVTAMGVGVTGGVIDVISVKIGEELKLDVLLSNADKVEHQSTSSKGWKEVWKRGRGVQNDQLNDRDGNLIINNFTANDAGIYRVWGSEEDILITVTVKETPGPPPSKKSPRSDAEQLNEISVKIGEELKLDILSNAEVVEHQDKTSKEWIKVWSRNKGVQSDRMNDTDGNLTIISFTSNDTGMYSILESDGQPLITVTVTVSSTELKGKQDKTHEDKTHNQIPVWVWILILTGVFLVALVAVVVIKKRKRLTMNGNNEQDYTPGVQM
ncbi:hypothetical protein ROHU_014980 [Labeo rohita]|uniref:Immunoglobulin domain-containing protein n=1 Tax=Labeo rohita TaxID=84645 RepID=A0A498NS35_LABRO|nr:hypothetical protein ROHU_014980 [Labeo rohita]